MTNLAQEIKENGVDSVLESMETEVNEQARLDATVSVGGNLAMFHRRLDENDFRMSLDDEKLRIRVKKDAMLDLIEQSDAASVQPASEVGLARAGEKEAVKRFLNEMGQGGFFVQNARNEFLLDKFFDQSVGT